MNKQCQGSFGSYNPETKEIFKGYIDKNGQMKFKPLSLWDRLIIWLNKPEPSEEFLGRCILTQRSHITNQVIGKPTAYIYKKGDNYYVKCNGYTFPIDGESLTRNNTIVLI